MLSDIGDMIQCGDIYEVFDGNAVEVDILLDYMTANNISPRHIYREVRPRTGYGTQNGLTNARRIHIRSSG